MFCCLKKIWTRKEEGLFLSIEKQNFIFHNSYNSRHTCIEKEVFEKNELFGMLMILYICLPGIQFLLLMAWKAIRAGNFLLLIPTLIFACIFPLLQIIVKLMLIVNNGTELKKLGEVLTFSEGQMESFFSLGLQLIIITRNPYRFPSDFQFFALSTSIVMLVTVQVNTYFSNSPCSNFKDDLKRKLSICPVFLIKNAFLLSTGAFVASVSPNAFLINLGFYCASIIFQKMTRSCNRTILDLDITFIINVFICIAFIIYRLILLGFAMKWTQGRYYFHGYIYSSNLGIMLYVTGGIYFILAFFTYKYTSNQELRITLLSAIYL